MRHSIEKTARLTVLCLFGLTGCIESGSLEGAQCPCMTGYQCCNDGICRTSCAGIGERDTVENEDTGDTNFGSTDSENDSSGGSGGNTPLPCDIFEAEGAPCVAAHSTVRVLREAYTGPLYQLCKGEAQPGPSACLGETLDIDATTNGYADGAAHAAFCGDEKCTITKVYDQAAHDSGPQNDLEPAPPGGAKLTPGKPVDAMALPIEIDGHPAYGMRFMPGMGYRAGCVGCAAPIGTDMAVGDEPQTIYMVTSAHDANSGCCFDYGNAETTCNNDHNATAEAVYFGFGVIWGFGSGDGPWVMADLEDGLFPGWDSTSQTYKNISTAQSLPHDFVNAVIVGDTADKNDGKGRFAVYGADAQTGPLIEMYDGIRPEFPGYVPMQKQGSIVLSIAGDNSDGDRGRFYEGAIATAPLDKSTLDDLQAAVVHARYGR